MGKICDAVDRGFVLSSSIKKMEKEFEGIKKTLKAHAKQYEKTEIDGEKAKAVVGDTGWSSADPQKLYSFLEDQGRVEDFWKLVSVKIQDVKKSVGDIGFSTIGTSGTVSYNKITFKKK